MAKWVRQQAQPACLGYTSFQTWVLSLFPHIFEQCPPPTQPAGPRHADKDDKKAWEGRRFPYSPRDPALLRNFQIQKRQKIFSPKSLSSAWSKAGLGKTVVQNCICNQPEMSTVTETDEEHWSKINYFDTFNTDKYQKLRNEEKKKKFAYLLHSSWKPHYHTCSHAFPSREHYRQLP